MKKILRTLDRFQKRRRSTAVAVATFKKFSEDHTTHYASTIAFWLFFSIFPLLLLVFITLLGWFLPAGDKTSVLGHVAQMFPLLDAKNVSSLTGSAWALILGVITALWSGLGAVRAAQSAFDSVWEVPYHERSGMAKQVIRAILVCATVGVGLVLSTLISGFVMNTSNGVNLGAAGRAGGYVLAAALDVALVVAAFRILTTRAVSVRDVLPGALLAGIVLFVGQQFSTFIISEHLRNAQATYGHFAVVITILWWFYLQSIVTLLAAQLNVVLKDGLYPRSLRDAPQTDADHRVLQAYAAERTYQPEEEVSARVSATRRGR
jgi:YihY family inner membrane protein